MVLFEVDPTVLYLLSCPRCFVPFVLSQQLSSPFCHVLAILSSLSCPSCPVSTLLSQLSRFSSSVPAVRSSPQLFLLLSFSDHPFLYLLFSPECPGLIILSWLSYTTCPAHAVLFVMTWVDLTLHS
jgi:hypothetical protein